MCEPSIAELGAALRQGSLTAVELAQRTLSRIAADRTLHAFVATTPQRALAAAARADAELQRGLDRGPMHGIPYAAKELFDVAGLATTGQSRLSRAAAVKDASVVTRLDKAGAVLVGKTATYELAMAPRPSLDGPFPPARNPHDLDRATGGSSSGCAAAIAGGLVPLALGTDTGGSIRAPAAYCGIVGLKPTYGRVSRRGVLPLSFSLDHVGPMAASIADAAMAFDVMAGFDPADPGSVDAPQPGCVAAMEQGTSGLRLGYARSFHAGDGDDHIRAALDRAADSFVRLGATVDEVDLPDPALFDAAAIVILQAEAFAIHRADLIAQPQAFGRETYRHLVAGAVLGAADLVQAQRVRSALNRVLQEQVFSRFDALLAANVLGTAPPLCGDYTPNGMRVFPFNLSGHPALALPMGTAANTMPIGLQLVGRPFGEAALFRLGAAFERHVFRATVPPQTRRSS